MHVTSSWGSPTSGPARSSQNPVTGGRQPWGPRVVWGGRGRARPTATHSLVTLGETQGTALRSCPVQSTAWPQHRHRAGNSSSAAGKQRGCAEGAKGPHSWGCARSPNRRLTAGGCLVFHRRAAAVRGQLVAQDPEPAAVVHCGRGAPLGHGEGARHHPLHPAARDAQPEHPSSCLG